MMETNKGCYITINTLLSLTNSDNIIIFSGDDIMLPNLVYEVMSVNGLFKRFQYYTYYNKNRIKRLNLYKIMVSLNRGQ